MPIPQIGYLAPVPGNPRQALPRSDWPVQSAVAALAGDKFFGPLASSAREVLRAWLLSQEIPADRLDHWIRALRGQFVYIPGDRSSARFNPFDHQEEAVRAMSCAGGIMNLGCSLGKTLATEVYVNAVAARFRGKPLVLASTRTALDGGAWDAYIPRFEALGFSKVWQVSIDSLHKFEPGFPSAGGLLVIDEAHMLGGAKARRTKHAMALRLKMDDALLLTGTLFHGGLERALTVMNLAIPGLAAFASTFQAAAFFNCLHQKTVGDQKYWEITKPTGKSFEAFKDFVTRRFVIALTKKSEIVRKNMEIPDQELTTLSFNGPWASVQYDAIQEIRRAIDAGEGIPTAAAVRHKLARAGLDIKLDWVLDTLEDGEPLVVFAKYRESLDAAAKRFTEAGIPFVRVDGDVTGDARRQAIADFQAPTGPQVFLGQCEAAGVSVELTRASVSVSLDSTWKGDAYDQHLARTCRFGQAKTCVHYDLVANALQQRIVETVRAGGVFDAAIAEFQDITRACAENGGQ